MPSRPWELLKGFRRVSGARVDARSCSGAHLEVTHWPSVLLQDGNVRLYSILGTTLKDEGKLLEAKGPVTDVAYSHDGAFLAVCDASKVVTVFSVADGYSVSGRPGRPCPRAGQCGWRVGAVASPPCHQPGSHLRLRGFLARRAEWCETRRCTCRPGAHGGVR